MKNKILIFNLILFPFFLRAQTIQLPQDSVMCPGTLTVVATASSNTNSGNIINGADDFITDPIDIGFSFVFYGITYTQCRLCSNNYLTFNMNEGAWWEATDTLPSTVAGPLNSIMFPWEDLNSTDAGTLLFAIVGSAPNRKFIYQICNSPFYSCNTEYFTGQVVLNETTNIIQTFISHKGLCAGSNEGSGIHGLQNSTGTIANIVPGRNYPSNWTSNNEGKKFTPNGSNNYIITTIPYTAYNPSVINWNINGVNSGGGDSITFYAIDTAIIIASDVSCSGIVSDTMNVFIPSVNLQLSTSQNYICYGNEVDLTAVGADNYLWVPGNSSSSVFTDAPTASTTYTVYGTTNSSCSVIDSATIAVEVNPLPSLIVSGLSDSVCLGEPVLFSATGADTYLWYPTLQTSSSMYFYPSTSVTLNCTGVDTTTGCSIIISSTVTVFPIPDLTVSSDTIICKGESVQLFAQGTSFYFWSSTQLSGNPVGSSIWVSPDTSTLYTVTGMSISGCQSSAAIQVQVTVCNSVSGIEKNSSLKIVPNPCEGTFLLKGISKNNSSKISITNLFGEQISGWKILSLSENEISIQLNAEISNGVYLINYETGKRNEKIKLILIR
ncbi:MAG: T9SS C-terminal target domain-containing protein [Sphingobacteriales bacterium]|nr:MAG: T9SS C-terminal target domain-containing protein [Sphingobacteriales bacterium]